MSVYVMQDRDGDLFAYIAKANKVYPVTLDVIPQRPELLHGRLRVKIRLMRSWWNVLERYGKRCRRHEGDADHLALQPGHQDRGCVR